MCGGDAVTLTSGSRGFAGKLKDVCISGGRSARRVAGLIRRIIFYVSFCSCVYQHDNYLQNRSRASALPVSLFFLGRDSYQASRVLFPLWSSAR
jgi:hypothetical protein